MQKTCFKCANFKSFNAHGGGAGTCGAGKRARGICLWAHAVHKCEKFEPKKF